MALIGTFRQSTAVNIIIGPFVSSTDGDTEMTALTIAAADVRLSKNAGADGAKNDATTCAHEGDGFYMCELDATDMNTVGQMCLWVHVATALAVRHDLQIVEEAVYDISFAASATGAVPVASIAANAITASSIAADAITDAKVASDVTIASVTGSVGSVTGAVGSVTGSVGSVATNGISAASLAADAGVEIAAAVWNEDATSHQTQGTFGQAIGDPVADTNTIFKAVVTDATGANVGADTTTILSSVATLAELVDGVWDEAIAGHLTAGTTGAALNGASAPSAIAVANQVWDTDATGHQTQGTFGQCLGDPVADTGTIFKATVTDATGVTVGTDSATILTRLGTPSDLGGGATFAANLVTVEAQTDDIGTAGAGLTALSTQASVNLIGIDVDAILALLDDARTEPAQGAPPVNPDLATKIDYLYKAWRNKKDNNATETKLYADNGTTVDHKQTTASASGTVTKGEWTTGA